MQKDRYDRRDSDTYRTGTTRPPKSRNGIIAILLVLVILLSGIISILGIVNIKLLKQLTATDATVPIAFSNTEAASQFNTGISGTMEVSFSVLGLTGEAVPTLYQSYYGLPQGFFITAVEADSAADRAGIRQGDILLSIDDRQIIDSDDFTSALHSLIPGQTVELTVFRINQKYSGQQLTLTVTVD